MYNRKSQKFIPFTVVETIGFKLYVLDAGPAPESVVALTFDENWYDESLYWRPWITNVLFDDIISTLPLNGTGIDDCNVKAPFCPILFASTWILGCDVLLKPIICSM